MQVNTAVEWPRNEIGGWVKIFYVVDFLPTLGVYIPWIILSQTFLQTRKPCFQMFSFHFFFSVIKISRYTLKGLRTHRQFITVKFFLFIRH